MLKNKERIQGYLAFHSFGNKILYPWGHTSKKTRDWKDLSEFANVAAEAIKENSVAQRRSFSESFSTDPLVSSYTVSQQSIRSKERAKTSLAKTDLRRIFLGAELAEQVSQTKEVAK